MANRWAVIIGINEYHDSLGRLKYSVNDCRRMAEVLTTGDDSFQDDHVIVLADDEVAERRPTYANIHSWLASWLAQPNENDTVLIFFAGHGREMEDKYYLVPCDATLQTIHVTGIPVPYIQELLNRCKARQKILILDACHSGAGRDVSTMPSSMMRTLSAGKGICTLTSCDTDELSHEWDEKKQGVFSYYLAEALSGSCPPDAHGRVTAELVYDWVYQRVADWAREKRCSQNPKRISIASGAITIMHADPDYRQIARDLQDKLDRNEAKLTALLQEFEIAKAKLGQEADLRATTEQSNINNLLPSLRAVAKRFLIDNAGSKRAWKSFMKQIRNGFPTLQWSDEELKKLLDAVHTEHWQSDIDKPSSTGKNSELKLIVLPENSEIRYRLNDEPVDKSRFEKPLPPGDHTITVIPTSLQFGMRHIRTHLHPGSKTRKVIHLRKIFHVRAILAVLIFLGYSAITNLLLSSVSFAIIDHGLLKLPAWGFILTCLWALLWSTFCGIKIDKMLVEGNMVILCFGVWGGLALLSGILVNSASNLFAAPKSYFIASFHALVVGSLLLVPFSNSWYRKRA